MEMLSNMEYMWKCWEEKRKEDIPKSSFWYILFHGELCSRGAMLLADYGRERTSRGAVSFSL